MKVLKGTGRRKMRKKRRNMKNRKTVYITHITQASLGRKRSSTWVLERLMNMNMNMSPHKKRKMLPLTNLTENLTKNLAKNLIIC